MFWLLFIWALIFLYALFRIKFYMGSVPNYPGKLPLIGHLHKFLGKNTDLWQFLKDLAETSLKMGNVLIVQFSEYIPAYVVTDPDDCAKILNDAYNKPFVLRRYTRNYLGEGLLFGPVSVWKDHRKLLNITFNQQVLDSFIDSFNIQSRQLVTDFEHAVGKGPFDHKLYFEKNGLRTICATALDADISNEYSDECLKSFQEILSIIIERVQSFLCFYDYFFNRSELRKREKQFIGNTHVFAETILKKKREEIANRTVEDGIIDAKFKPFIYQLLQQENKTLTEREVKDEINVMIIAGFETSATVLLYTLTLVGTYPHIQQKICEEIDEVFGDCERDVTKEDLSKLKYIEAVLKETTRYCPIVPLVGRKLIRDVKLSEYAELLLQNCVLKKGFICMVMMYGAMRHSIWGPDADQYVPERWLDPDRLPKNPHAYLAFGYGKRNCIGKTYALMTMKIVMVHFFRRYKVVGDFSKVQLKFLGVLKPHSGHHIGIEYRNKQNNIYCVII